MHPALSANEEALGHVSKSYSFGRSDFMNGLVSGSRIAQLLAWCLRKCSVIALRGMRHRGALDGYGGVGHYRIRPRFRFYQLAVQSGLAAVMAVGLKSALAACTLTAEQASHFDRAQLSAHIRTLASDEFEGRAPASEGEVKSIDYIKRHFAAFGLEPGGDRGAWSQEVPLRKFEMIRAPSLRIKAGTGSYVLENGNEVVVASLAGQEHIAMDDVPIVFVGYGITAPELAWDDFKGADLRGKVALFLINDADFEAPVAGRFGGRAMTYYGRWKYKFEEAARRGAAAALIVHEDAPAGYRWATVQNSWGAPRFDIARPNPGASHPLLEGWMSRRATEDLLRPEGPSLDALKQMAMQPGFRPRELRHARLSFTADVAVSQVVSHNLVAKRVGRVQTDEAIIYSAHWDHLGVGAPDAKADRIYNGAVDNASGIAGLLELARAFAAAPPTARSIYFIAFTAEDMGLLGSEYYTTQPIIALERTAAVFNMDMLGISGPACDLSVWGNEKSGLDDILASIAATQGRSIVPDAHLEAGYFYRSDHFSFAKRGVPALTIRSGENLLYGGSLLGRRATDEYIAYRYHQPGDEWSAQWDLRGMAMDLDLVYRAGQSIANSSAWPEWKEGSPFKAIREQSRNLRAPNEGK